MARAKVTSKLQVTVPKTIAARYGIRPGDEIEWQPAGAVIQIVPPGKQAPALSLDARLKLYDAATARQRHRQAGRPKLRPGTDRGWRREDRAEAFATTASASPIRRSSSSSRR